MSDTQQLIGKLITGKMPERDAIHIAVYPVIAWENLAPGMQISLNEEGKAKSCPIRWDDAVIGVVDPFLQTIVHEGERFWMFLLPNTITSLKHHWTHPALPAEITSVPTKVTDSEQWMRAWAVEHMSEDYYGDGERLSEEHAYMSAIKAGHTHHLGPYESARDHINDEWWGHWEKITGVKGQRTEYFRCAC